MQTLSEKRVYGDRSGARSCFVASDTGLVRVRVTGTAVGEFSLVDRRSAQDLAVTGPRRGGSLRADEGPSTLAVATDADVLVATEPSGPDLSRESELTESTNDQTPEATASTSALSDALEPTGFGSATAVTVVDGSVVAAGSDGVIRRLDTTDGVGEWHPVDAPPNLSVRAIDGPLFATDRGVFRLEGDRLQPAGLDQAVVDVAGSTDVGTGHDDDAAGIAPPLAATPAGLYALETEWRSLTADSIDAVAAVPATPSADQPRAVAISGSTLLTVDPTADDPSPRSLAVADDPLVDLTVGPDGVVYAISEAGTLLAVGPDDVRRHAIGVRGPTAIASVATNSP